MMRYSLVYRLEKEVRGEGNEDLRRDEEGEQGEAG